MHVSAPKFQWIWNPNTIAVLVGFLITGGGWVVNYTELQNVAKNNTTSLNEVRAELDSIDELEDNVNSQGFRLSIVERQVSDTSDAIRALEQSISSMSADVRVQREILERLERSINGATRTNLNTAASR